jgi:hypothetical protein
MEWQESHITGVGHLSATGGVDGIDYGGSGHMRCSIEHHWY